MKIFFMNCTVLLLLFYGCSTSSNIPKGKAYKSFYEQKPASILLMPPINRSTNIEAKEYFHSTLNIPLANQGYYVIPPFISIEMLKRESAYDAELFLESSLEKFRETFGADLVLFTVIHKWDKSGIAAIVNVDIEYMIKSTTTNKLIYSRRGDIKYDTSVSTGLGGLGGLVADLAASAINTAIKKYVDVARACNSYTLSDLPAGAYHPKHLIDNEEMAGKKEFNANINQSSGY